MSIETIRLPPALGTPAEIESLAHRLRARSCVLDWSDVVAPEASALAILLAGIELDEYGDELGLDTMADDVATAVDAHFAARPAPAKLTGKKRGKANLVAGAPAPQVWAETTVGAGASDVADSEPPPSSALPIVAPTAGAAVLKEVDRVELRERLQEAIVNDLLGPVNGPQEELSHHEASVRDRYFVGMLAPRLRERDVLEEPEMQDELAPQTGGGEEEGGAAEPTASPNETMFPSSFGLTFCVAGDTRAVRVVASWGRYRKEASTLSRKADDSPHRVWKRTPESGEVLFDLAEGPIAPRAPLATEPTIVVQGAARRVDGELIVSLFLVNGLTEPEKNRDEAWLFQPELRVEATDGAPIFRKRPARDTVSADPLTQAEVRGLEMAYRNRREFAIGHGVSVHADVAPGDPTRATAVKTRVVPVHDVARVEAPDAAEIPELAGLELDMQMLYETDDAAVLGRKLKPITKAYDAWIETQRARAESGVDGLGPHREAAAAALARCLRAKQRIEDGIARLQSDPLAFRAFRFANRAMWQQRVRSTFAEAVRRGEKPALEAIDVPANRRWRPFQLAFVLLGFPSLADLAHPDRTDAKEALADLLWFPTGGGKTEAYLGLAAFAMGIRRLQGIVEGRSGEHGVTVLMRYTLRLLTLQQFQRATALICACELIRREALEAGDLSWGSEPFRIGLWVGSKATPNSTADADAALGEMRGLQHGSGKATPAQLTNCPWCGRRIDPGKHMEVRSGTSEIGRTLVFCGDDYGTCPFSKAKSKDEGIPAIVVDEEIYRRLPTLLIATVDKFAQMPWNGTTKLLFGELDTRCSRHGFRAPDLDDTDTHRKAGALPAAETTAHLPLRPPDLIIQDELHLISGPLGTLTGLYETAVDELSTWTVAGKRVRPKVIASTATIRRAREQVHALFLRNVEIFPPSGLDVEDNFFSRERDPTKVAGRRYLGICAPGRRLKVALIRVYTAQMAAAQQLFDRGGDVDPWMTLVGYFNSLRELAGMRRLVEDDVRSRLRDMDTRGLARRPRPRVEELTSRRRAAEIPALLDRMELTFQRDAAKREPGKKGRAFPIDVLLATNMISVGVDVKRLGAMVTSGQPKTTAEYIQATSRVGRVAPGLVITVYNWAKPRDLSHYETFEHYHATFYRHVESLSVTPFASRALDRGLSGVLVALVRLAQGGYPRNEDAQRIRRDDSVVEHAIEVLCRRAERVSGSHIVGDQVRAMLKRRLDVWSARASEPMVAARLGFKSKKDGSTRGLLEPAGEGAWNEFTCLNSLRDVEPTAALILDEGADAFSTAKEIW